MDKGNGVDAPRAQFFYFTISRKDVKPGPICTNEGTLSLWASGSLVSIIPKFSTNCEKSHSEQSSA